MEFDAKKQDGANVLVKAKMSKQDIEKHIDKMAKDAAKTMDIAGFRKGKVPVSEVKKRHLDKLREDSEAEVLREIISSSFEELKLIESDILAQPNIKKYDKKDDGGLEIEISISVKPEMDLSAYKELLPEVKEKATTAKDVSDRIEEFAKSMGELEPIKTKRAVKSGDFVEIDFEGFIDGKPFDGAKAQNHLLEIGSNSFIPGFEEKIIGFNIGDDKEIEVNFPSEYQAKELAGKKSIFKIKLNEIKTRAKTIIDDEFAKKMLPNEKDASLEKLKTQIKEQIKHEKKTKYYNEDLKPTFMAKLVKELKFDLPQTIVDQELDMALNNKAREMSEEELTKLKDDPKEIEKLKKTLEPSAKESVKATFIIDALAKAENVEVKDEEVQQVIYYEAMQRGADPKESFENYSKNGYLLAIKISMLEEKVITKLLDEKLAKSPKSEDKTKIEKEPKKELKVETKKVVKKTPAKEDKSIKEVKEVVKKTPPKETKKEVKKAPVASKKTTSTKAKVEKKESKK